MLRSGSGDGHPNPIVPYVAVLCPAYEERRNLDLLSNLSSAESVRVLCPDATTCRRRWAMRPRPRRPDRVSGQGLWPSGTHALSGAGQPVAAAGEVLPLAGEPAPVWPIGGGGGTRCDVA